MESCYPSTNNANNGREGLGHDRNVFCQHYPEVMTFLTTLMSWGVKMSALVLNIVHVLINRGRRGRRNCSSSTIGRASDWDSRPESGGGRYLTPNDRALIKSIEHMSTTATVRSRNPLLCDASPLSAPPRADRGGKTPDPSLGGVCQFLWPQHTHHRAGSVRTRGSLLWLQRPRPGGEGVVTTAPLLLEISSLSIGIWTK